MKIRGKILTLALLPMLILSIGALFFSLISLGNNITRQAHIGMEATAITLREAFDKSVAGDYSIDEAGNLWKGSQFNVSTATEMVDSVKSNTGYDVTVFYGDTRVLTSIVNEAGERQVGTKASDEVISTVLEQGENFQSDRVDVLGTRYVSCYIPLYQYNTNTPIGMIFLGEPYENIQEILDNAYIQLLKGAFAIILVVFVAAAIISTKMAKGMRLSASYVKQMGNGRLGVRISERSLKRKDEIGDIFKNVSLLDKNLTDIMRDLQTQSESLEITSTDCNKSAGKVFSSVEQINAAIEEIAASSTAQATDAVQAENSVKIIGEIMNETDASLQEFAATTEEMSQAADSAEEILAELNQSMNQVKNAVHEIYIQTNETHTSVQKIGEMTEIITEIAAQTNLLSLNASIEAARAGEMGRGFAVVATEIQKLAEQCNTSAEEIQQVLTQLKGNSDVAVNTMQEVQDIILVQEDKLSKTNEAFKTVEGGIHQTTGKIGDILSGMNTLNEARVSTIGVVKNVADIAQQNAASTQETAAAVDEVTQLVSTMTDNMTTLNEVAAILKDKSKAFEI